MNGVFISETIRYRGGVMRRIGGRVYWQGLPPPDLALIPGTLEQHGFWLSMEVEGWEPPTITVNRNGLPTKVTFETTVAASDELSLGLPRIKHDTLRPFEGKRVKVTVEEVN